MRWKISYGPHADGTDRGNPRDAGEAYACRRVPLLFEIETTKSLPTWQGFLRFKQITGIEPAFPAWEAGVLPMNHICGYVAVICATAVCNMNILSQCFPHFQRFEKIFTKNLYRSVSFSNLGS